MADEIRCSREELKVLILEAVSEARQMPVTVVGAPASIQALGVDAPTRCSRAQNPYQLRYSDAVEQAIQDLIKNGKACERDQVIREALIELVEPAINKVVTRLNKPTGG